MSKAKDHDYDANAHSNKTLSAKQIEARKLLRGHVPRFKPPKKKTTRQGDRFANLVRREGW